MRLVISAMARAERSALRMLESPLLMRSSLNAMKRSGAAACAPPTGTASAGKRRGRQVGDGWVYAGCLRLVGRVDTPQALLAEAVVQLRPGQPVGEDGHGLRGRRGSVRHAVLEVLQPVWKETRREDTPARRSEARLKARLRAVRHCATGAWR